MFLGVPLAIAVINRADCAARCGRCRAARLVRCPGLVDAAKRARVRCGHDELPWRAQSSALRAAGTLAIRDPGGIDANLLRRREELEQARLP